MLTPLELDIMKAVWRLAPATVRDVQGAIRPSRNLAYTTVMTIMDRLYHKGSLTRQLQSRTHLYEPAIAFADVRDEAVRTLLENFFGGSEGQLRDFLEAGPAHPDEHGREVSTPATLDETLL